MYAYVGACGCVRVRVCVAGGGRRGEGLFGVSMWIIPHVIACACVREYVYCVCGCARGCGCVFQCVRVRAGACGCVCVCVCLRAGPLNCWETRKTCVCCSYYMKLQTLMLCAGNPGGIRGLEGWTRLWRRGTGREAVQSSTLASLAWLSCKSACLQVRVLVCMRVEAQVQCVFLMRLCPRLRVGECVFSSCFRHGVVTRWRSAASVHDTHNSAAPALKPRCTSICHTPYKRMTHTLQALQQHCALPLRCLRGAAEALGDVH